MDTSPDEPITKQKTTSPFLTKFERARILGARANQISRGAPPLVPIEGMTDALEIAKSELRQKAIPFIIRRYLPDGSFEDWDIKELLGGDSDT